MPIGDIMKLTHEVQGANYRGSLGDIQAEIRDHAKQAVKNVGDKPVTALPQGPATPLRVKQVAGPGEYPLVSTQPGAKLVK